MSIQDINGRDTKYLRAQKPKRIRQKISEKEKIKELKKQLMARIEGFIYRLNRTSNHLKGRLNCIARERKEHCGESINGEYSEDVQAQLQNYVQRAQWTRDEIEQLSKLEQNMRILRVRVKRSRDGEFVKKIARFADSFIPNTKTPMPHSEKIPFIIYQISCRELIPRPPSPLSNESSPEPIEQIPSD